MGFPSRAGTHHASASVSHPYPLPRPSFVKLEQWLETLHMHLAGHGCWAHSWSSWTGLLGDLPACAERTARLHPEVPD